MPKPPPAVNTGNTVLCEVSLASSVVVIEQPLRITLAASPATMVLPRRMPCWSGNDRRTTSSLLLLDQPLGARGRLELLFGPQPVAFDEGLGGGAFLR